MICGFMGFAEKILLKSNSFRYYKDKYNKLNKENKKLKKRNYKLQFEVIDLKKHLHESSKRDIHEKLINGQFNDINISIKTPNPKGHHHWGDHFYAMALKKSFIKQGFNVEIHEKEDWYGHENEDIVIVLRGLTNYNVNYESINIIWNISHPDRISYSEYEKYDVVFIASDKYARLVKQKINSPVFALLQCCDPEVFYPKENDNLKENEILFVGSTRNVYRDVIKDISKTKHSFSVFGPGWEDFIDEKYIKDDFVPNEMLNQYYSSCKILLNDHWEDMKENGFISNRIFDALACGCFVISDKMQEIDNLFEGNVITYNEVKDLDKKLDYYLTHDDERNEKALKGKDIVLNNHTFDNRVDEIINALKNINF